jgi:hypothetical protein
MKMRKENRLVIIMWGYQENRVRQALEIVKGTNERSKGFPSIEDWKKDAC